MLGLLRKYAFSGHDASGLDLSQPIDAASYVVVDTELTGLDARTGSIVSIGGIRMTGGRIELGKTFYEVVRPRTSLSSESVVIHGIMPSETESRPGIEKVLENFLEFCEQAVIVGHFIALDMGFLGRELQHAGMGQLRNPVVDTNCLNEWMAQYESEFRSFGLRRSDNKDLFSLAGSFNVPVQGAHNALMDAFITAQLFQRFLGILMKLGVRTLRDLLRIGKP